jgi:hypothetical protein
MASVVAAAAAAEGDAAAAAPLLTMVTEANDKVARLLVEVGKAKGNREELLATPELAEGLRELQRTAGKLAAAYDPAVDWDRVATRTLVANSDNVVVAVHTDEQQGGVQEDLQLFKDSSTVWAYIEALTKPGSYQSVDVQKYRDKKDKQLYTVVSVLRHARNKNAIRPLLLLNTYHMKMSGTPDRLIAHFNQQGFCAGSKTYRDILEAKSQETQGLASVGPFCYVIYISDNFGVMIKGPNAGYLGMVTQSVQVVPFKLLEFIANMHRPEFLTEFYGGVVVATGDSSPRWEVMRGYEAVLKAEFGDASNFVDYERLNAYRVARLTCNLQGCLQQIRRKKEFVASVGVRELAKSQGSSREPRASVLKLFEDETTEEWTTTPGSTTRRTPTAPEDAASPPGGVVKNFLRRNNVFMLQELTDKAYSKDDELRTLWDAAGGLIGVGVRPTEGSRVFLVAGDGCFDKKRADSIKILDAGGAGLYDGGNPPRIIVQLLVGIVLPIAPTPEGPCPGAPLDIDN